MNKDQRNDRICTLYREGITQEALAAEFNLTESRIGQILKRAGLTKEDRLIAKSHIDRPSFTGVHLAIPVKEALRQECKANKISMSRFISNLVTKELRDRGIKIQTPSEPSMPLPFEG